MSDPGSEHDRAESKPDAPNTLDHPVRKARTVRLLVILSPVMLAGCYIIAWLQGAEPRYAGLIGLVAALMSLSAAAAIHLLGSKSWIALVAVKIALVLMAKSR